MISSRPDTSPQPKPTGFNVHTQADIEAMLAAMGLHDLEQLFADIPNQVRLQRPLNLPTALSEWELQRDLRQMAGQNSSTQTHACYLGGGAYAHYIPAVIEAIASRGEFLTAYTPYQPEMSQGLLQALFEFQTLVGRLLAHDCVNCSVYDGATALAEASWMMCSATRQRRVLVPQTLWPDYREVLNTYLLPRGVQIETLAMDAASGLIDPLALARHLQAGDVAGVLLQTPNALGVVEDVAQIAALCKPHGALLCASTHPLLCGWIEPPGALGADITTCEGQSLGLALNAGGPTIGIIACAKPLERFLPGRLVGRLHDLNGKLGYALVKEDREQHVARDKATSHICSNQALNAIRVALYLACLGQANVKRIAQVNAAQAAYLKAYLLAMQGVHAVCSGVSFNEFAVALPVDAAAFCAAMRQRGIFAGLPIAPELLGHARGLLIAVTETKSLADLNHYAAQAAACISTLSAAAIAELPCEALA